MPTAGLLAPKAASPPKVLLIMLETTTCIELPLFLFVLLALGKPIPLRK